MLPMSLRGLLQMSVRGLKTIHIANVHELNSRHEFEKQVYARFPPGFSAERLET